MSFPSLDRFLAEYQAAGFDVEPEGEHQFVGLCPVHGDTNPSLAIGRAKSGQVLLACRSGGCKAEAILRAVRKAKLKPSAPPWYALPGAQYVYRDRHGVEKYE